VNGPVRQLLLACALGAALLGARPGEASAQRAPSTAALQKQLLVDNPMRLYWS